jgi:hypothetical protein
MYLAGKNQRVIQCTSRLDTPNEGDANSWQNKISVLEGRGHRLFLLCPRT